MSETPRKRAAAGARTARPARRQTELAGATISEFDGVRYLHLGTDWVQGAMRLRKPRALELDYIQRMMAWLLWRPIDRLEPDGGQAVQLGLGAAAITRWTHQVLRWPTRVVELNPSVITACRLWFHLPDDDARLQVIEDDAGAWVQRPEQAGTADALCVDLYDHDAAAPVLDDEAFYAACRDLLVAGDAHTPGGLMTVNLFGRQSSFARSSARIAEAFGADQVWQLAPTPEGNTVVVAGRGVIVPDRETLTARAEAIESRFGLPARKWLRMVRPWTPVV